MKLRLPIKIWPRLLSICFLVAITSLPTIGDCESEATSDEISIDELKNILGVKAWVINYTFKEGIGTKCGVYLKKKGADAKPFSGETLFNANGSFNSKGKYRFVVGIQTLTDARLNIHFSHRPISTSPSRIISGGTQSSYGLAKNPFAGSQYSWSEESKPDSQNRILLASGGEVGAASHTFASIDDSSVAIFFQCKEELPNKNSTQAQP